MEQHSEPAERHRQTMLVFSQLHFGVLQTFLTAKKQREERDQDSEIEPGEVMEEELDYRSLVTIHELRGICMELLDIIKQLPKEGRISSLFCVTHTLNHDTDCVRNHVRDFLFMFLWGYYCINEVAFLWETNHDVLCVAGFHETFSFIFQVSVAVKDELVEIAVDRLAQIIQVAKTADCLSGRKCKSCSLTHSFVAPESSPNFYFFFAAEFSFIYPNLPRTR